MIERILGLSIGGAEGSQDGLQLALTALLVAVADSDDYRRETVRSVSSHLLAADERKADYAAEPVHFIRIISERLSFEQEVGLLEIPWVVSDVNAVLDGYKDSLPRPASAD
jgi:hypothetical protein